MSCLIVIFGGSGDLTKRKLIPAMYRLFIDGALEKDWGIISIGRSSYTDDSYCSAIRSGLKEYESGSENCLDEYLSHISYFQMDPTLPENYILLKNRLKDWVNGNILFYLSTPPVLYQPILNGLFSSGLSLEDHSFRRIIIEKPFGTDYASAQELRSLIQQKYSESQIFRIDHYLGKETVQNMLAFRFGNSIFEPLWNRNYIQRVEITAAESLGVENRAGYYENAGALRDMIQNHLLQVLGFVAMEPPAVFEAESIRNETTKVLKALRPLAEDSIKKNVIRGQYLGASINQLEMKPYRNEPGVDPASRTETYCAVRSYIDNWRWAGVPFYIRTGKNLPVRVTEVVIYFRQTPHGIFRTDSDSASTGEGNVLVIRIQPDEGILLTLNIKEPGMGFQIREENLHFKYQETEQKPLTGAYERLILDCLMGDQTLYARSDSVEVCWQYIQPILAYWKNNPDCPLYGYPSGTWGPLEARSLFDFPAEDWRFPCKNLVNTGGYCEL